MTCDPIHDTAARGFEANAREYELARPGYPADAIEFLRERLGLKPGTRVVDVGAGTGKLTRLLVPTGAEVVAIEPVGAMRAQLARVLPGLVVHDASASHLPLGDTSVDAVVCAQAFHWFATAEVLLEFARVLFPGGHLALVWNVRDHSVGWVEELTALLRPYEGDRPDHNRGEWRAAFGPDVPFSVLETRFFHHEQPMTPDLLVARAASMSFVATLEETQRSEVLTRVRLLGERQGANFAMPYRTDVHLAQRL